MYKKPLKSLKKLSNSSDNRKTLRNLKNNKNLTIIETVIGASNVKRWNSLKTLFSCETNEKFATKLLDLAQEHLNRNKCKENDNKKNKPSKNNPEELPSPPISNKNKSKNSIPKPLLEKNIEPPENPSTSNSTPLESSNKDEVKKKVPVCRKKVNDIRKAPELNTQIENTLENKSMQNDTASVAEIRIKLCQNCGTRHIQDHCPLNYPNFVIHNQTNYEDWETNFKSTYLDNPDNDEFSFAKMSIPSVLKFGASLLPAHGLGVFTDNEIEEFTQLGPLCGRVVKEVDISEDSTFRDLWEIHQEEGNIYYNTEDWAIANWIRFVRPAPTREEKNMTAIVRQNLVYFVTTRIIKAGEELLYWQDTLSAMNKKKMEKTSCGGCNMTFAHPIYYRTHCSVFHDVRYSLTIRKYHCKVCGTAVLGKENIMKHAADLHNGQGAYQCQYCKKFFLRLNYLEMHRTYGCSANPHRSRPLCDFCGRKFCQPQKLKVHIKRMHSDFAEVLKEFQCKVCLKILGSRAALQRHLKEVHHKLMDGACSCIKCGKHFQNKSNLKIHMLTHSGLKPFRCVVKSCNAAFTTKQCLQFHYKKVHNFGEEVMPKIERSIDYTFEAYSGLDDNDDPRSGDDKNTHDNSNDNLDDDDDDDSDDDESLDSKIDDPIEDNPSPNPEPELSNSPPAQSLDYNPTLPSTKVLTKGSKKWIGDPLPQPPYQIDTLESQYRAKGLSDFNRHEASNASLLVEAALDSVCSEPNIDIDVSTTSNCTDPLNNLYIPTDTLPDVTYSDSVNRDINLISPSVNDHISVTDELGDELAIRNQNQNIMDYSTFHQEDFSPANSPEIQNRTNFVRNYIESSLSPPQNYAAKSPVTNVPSPPRYDFGHGAVVAPSGVDHLSSDESNGMGAQNLTLHSKQDMQQLDLSIYRRKSYDEGLENDPPGEEVQLQNKDRSINKYSDELSTDLRSNKFDLDLDLRIKNYEESDPRPRGLYENDLDFRTKTNYDSTIDKGYDSVEQPSDFRDRNFEPLVLNSELQGLDMSARSLQYPNINRYHHLYPDVDRVDLRLNYSPPAPSYSHADILRVVSLDLTPPGRHSVDLSLRSHPLQLHGIQPNHRLLDPRHLSTDSRLLESTRLLSDHTTNRILCNNDQLSLLSSSAAEDSSRLLDQGRLIGDGRILATANPNGTVSPVPAFSGYSQNPYHPTPLGPRPHVTSPNPYHHYPAYY